MSLTAAEARARRAALALHALADDDRVRVLGMLDDPQRSRVQPLLQELQDLGIPRGVAAPDAAPHAPQRQAGAVRERLSMIDPLMAATVLDRCGTAAVAALLRVAPPHWTASALAALSPAQRQSVNEQFEATALPAAKTAEALCAALEAALQPAQGNAVARPAVDGTRLTQRMLRWIR
jgi:Lon protease-like protein